MNLTPDQKSDFESLVSAIQRSGVSGSRLEVESPDDVSPEEHEAVTETHNEATGEVLKRLSALLKTNRDGTMAAIQAISDLNLRDGITAYVGMLEIDPLDED